METKNDFITYLESEMHKYRNLQPKKIAFSMLPHAVIIKKLSVNMFNTTNPKSFRILNNMSDNLKYLSTFIKLMKLNNINISNLTKPQKIVCQVLIHYRKELTLNLCYFLNCEPKSIIKIIADIQKEKAKIISEKYKEKLLNKTFAYYPFDNIANK